MKPYFENGKVSIYHGDCLDVLDSLVGDGASFDAVVMDPPYASGTRKEMSKSSSGAMLRGERFAKRPIENDQMTTQGFVWLMRAVAQIVRPAIPEGASILSFIDWRQWPNLVGAFETCNYRIQSMIVWDKINLGMGNGFRRQHELICHASKGTPKVYNRGTPDVISAKRERPIDHPSPKPVELMAKLVRVVLPPEGVLLDPFAGAGATLQAGVEAGASRVFGIESQEQYCEVAANRLSQGVLDFAGVQR